MAPTDHDLDLEADPGGLPEEAYRKPTGGGWLHSQFNNHRTTMMRLGARIKRLEERPDVTADHYRLAQKVQDLELQLERVNGKLSAVVARMGLVATGTATVAAGIGWLVGRLVP